MYVRSRLVMGMAALEHLSTWHNQTTKPSQAHCWTQLNSVFQSFNSLYLLTRIFRGRHRYGHSLYNFVLSDCLCLTRVTSRRFSVSSCCCWWRCLLQAQVCYVMLDGWMDGCSVWIMYVMTYIHTYILDIHTYMYHVVCLMSLTVCVS